MTNPVASRPWSRRGLPAIGFALLALAAPVAAQDNSADVIIVEGRREVTVGQVREQAHSITPRAGSVGEPLARVQQEICAGVWGLEEDGARLIIDRIYHNAEALGLPISADEGCIANILVAIVPDPRATFAELRQHDHKLVEGLDLWERKRVAEQEGPVLAWNAISTRSNNGIMALGNPPVFDTTQTSRLQTGIRKDIEMSVVLIASEAVAGKDGVAVADYATMRTLAHTRTPISETAVGTILDLFDDEAAPRRLSAFDRAYLQSLYEGPADRPMNLAMSHIGSSLREALVEPE